MAVRWSILSPRGSTGALGLVELTADDEAQIESIASALFTRAGIDESPRVRRMVLAGGFVDDVVVFRRELRLWIMPHGGIAVMRSVVGALITAGATEDDRNGKAERWPEAADELEARMLTALAFAASPRGVTLLLDQPGRRGRDAVGEAHARQLARLLDPALVALVGPANVGKSTMLNALAGRRAAIVADEPGTTRDHVGVRLELDGVCVQMIDTPGVRADAGPLETTALERSLEVMRRAALIVWCGSPTEPPPDPASLGLEDVPGLRICLQRDRGTPSWTADLEASLLRAGPEEVARVARGLREEIVSDAALADPGAWRFWEHGDAAGPHGD